MVFALLNLQACTGLQVASSGKVLSCSMQTLYSETTYSGRDISTALSRKLFVRTRPGRIANMCYHEEAVMVVSSRRTEMKRLHLLGLT